MIRGVLLRQAEVTETWGAGVDILTRQIDAAGARPSGAAAEMREVAELIEQTLGSLSETAGAWTSEMEETGQAQTAAICGSIAKLGESLAASTREAASNIALARHELALSVAELKRRPLGRGMLLGGAVAILILLAARLLFPFWGMTRADVEAWSRGTELARTYSEASPQERQAILRALKWERMPGAPATAPSASSEPRAGGR